MAEAMETDILVAEGTRLVIKEMVLENFKSYAGKQKVGPFHKNFSSVVGPNGSGKSNVIDAMLFVFGKRAKQLRLNKVSELIHNSTNHQNLPMAKVSVHFVEIIDKGDNDFEELPGTSMVVSRTAHRDNKSDYYIDDRKSTFTAVTALLKGKGIDLDNNRFLILQGEVEQISLMKPRGADKNDTGLLEYLEDIIGTDKYVEAIEMNAKKLEELNEVLAGVRQRAKLVQEERDALEAKKAVAEAYLKKERERLVAEATLAHVFIYDGTKTIAKLDSNIGQLEEKLKYERQKFVSYNKDLEEAKSKFKASDAERAAIQAQCDNAEEELKEFERRDIKHKEDRKHCKAKLKKAEEKLAKDASKLQELESNAAKLERDIPAIGAKTERLTAELAKQEQVLEGLYEGIKSEVEALRQKLQVVRGELAPWEAQLGAVQSRIDVATAERGFLLQKQATAQQRLQDAEGGQLSASKAAEEKEASILKIERTMKMLRGEVEHVREGEAASTAEINRLEAGLKEVRGKVEQRRATANSQSTAGAVVKALLAAKAAGDLPGIYGRLGDLGAIDARYDVAASSSAGALDFIVVDTTTTAQRCVELLRRQSLGVATFLILEKQQNLVGKMQERVQPPEGAPRLFDLVKVRDPALGVAFYFAMRDTVVATDLEQASRIAYGPDKRWAKVVTLKGEMINESGTMTGGGGKPRSGRMCLGTAAPRRADDKASASELVSAEKELACTQKDLEKARSKASEAAAAVRAAEKQLAALETAVPKARMEADSLRATARDLSHRLAELKAATQMSEEEGSRVQTLAAEVATAEKELASLRKSAAGLQAKSDKLTAAMEVAGGDKLRQQKELVEQMLKDITAKEGERTRAEVQAAAAHKAAAKLRKDSAKGETERAKHAADLEAMKAIFKDLEDQALVVLQLKHDTEGRLQEKAVAAAQVSADYERKKTEVGLIKSTEVEIQNKLSDQSEVRKGEDKKLRHWTKEAAKKRTELTAAFPEGECPPELTTEELDAMDTAQAATDLQYQATLLGEEMQRANPDLDAIERWKAKDAEFAKRSAEVEASRDERDAVRRTHEELRKKRLDGFMSGFNTISLKLKEMYQMITLGGDAELELVDSLDPFSEGIVFSVRPPKKSWKNIANLSGGEKTLSSLSLVFALHHYKPTPLYVMDEIDAALDFKNVSIVAHYIKERTKNAQFIIISLRNNMFELADRLVGIYKTDNATKSVAINPGEFVVGRPSALKCLPASAHTLDKEQQPPTLTA